MLPIIKNQASYWKHRKIDWKSHYFVPHAHQNMIMDKLMKMTFGSIAEVGCGAGKNIYLIKKRIPYVQVGGTDINADAIQTAKDIFTENGIVAEFLEVCPADDLFMNDKSADVLLTDACLLYVDDIDKVIGEFRRVTRNAVVFVELHSDNWWDRFKLLWKTGYRTYDFNKLLRGKGFYDVRIEKIPEEIWPGEPWSRFGSIITAKL